MELMPNDPPSVHEVQKFDSMPMISSKTILGPDKSSKVTSSNFESTASSFMRYLPNTFHNNKGIVTLNSTLTSNSACIGTHASTDIALQDKNSVVYEGDCKICEDRGATPELESIHSSHTGSSDMLSTLAPASPPSSQGSTILCIIITFSCAFYIYFDFKFSSK